MKLNSILVVDDSQVDLEIVSIACASLDCEIEMANNSVEALQAYKERRHTLVLADYVMEPLNGIELIKQIKSFDPDASCLLMTGYPDTNLFDFVDSNDLPSIITKPIRPNHLTEKIRVALNRHRGASERMANVAVSNRMDNCLALLGQSYEICQVRKQLADCLNSSKLMLLEGPIGIGKPDIARFVHSVGPFAESHYVECCCKEMSREKMEQELINEDGELGHMLKSAHHGTLVLRNVECLPKTLQAPLAKEFKTIVDNCYVITITDAKIDELFEAGSLDTNLYFELSLESIHIPGLSERPADIEEIVRFIANDPGRFGLGYRPGATELDLLVAEFRQSELEGNIDELLEKMRQYCRER